MVIIKIPLAIQILEKYRNTLREKLKSLSLGTDFHVIFWNFWQKQGQPASMWFSKFCNHFSVVNSWTLLSCKLSHVAWQKRKANGKEINLVTSLKCMTITYNIKKKTNFRKAENIFSIVLPTCGILGISSNLKGKKKSLSLSITLVVKQWFQKLYSITSSF